MPRLSWTQPICDPCWSSRFPGLEPTRLFTKPQERCSFCGETTKSGVYVRASPAEVPYPAEKEE